jgi:hypothetical protein
MLVPRGNSLRSGMILELGIITEREKKGKKMSTSESGRQKPTAGTEEAGRDCSGPVSEPSYGGRHNFLQGRGSVCRQTQQETASLLSMRAAERPTFARKRPPLQEQAVDYPYQGRIIRYMDDERNWIILEQIGCGRPMGRTCTNRRTI